MALGRASEPNQAHRTVGFTLVEILLALAISSILVVGLGGVVMTSLSARSAHQIRFELSREAAFALRRMTDQAGQAGRLLIPLLEDPRTEGSEALVEPGLLAFALGGGVDRDRDGFADADNDRDGRVDEDLPRDSNADGAVGVGGFDDDNSGIRDISLAGVGDDDETGFFGGADEDPIDGIDNDGDGTIDEDPGADMNGDGAPGIAGVDDDGDGTVDEGSANDDDEDGVEDEDWYDVVAYKLSGQNLIERMPNLSPVDGRDYTERTIAENVTTFRVERLAEDTRRMPLVELTLVLSKGDQSVHLSTRVRVGMQP